MYEFFRGIPVHIDTNGNCCLDVNGVGYRMRISEFTRNSLPLDGSSVTLHARMVVREDEHLLFGFHDPAERAAFDLLTAVQGVGPAVAMAILSTLGVDALRNALAQRAVAVLRTVKGVGAKSAERLILECHDKVERIPGAMPVHSSGSVAAQDPLQRAREEAHRALVALGFSVKESEAALAGVVEAPDAESFVRAALARLRSA